jgi:hypothetical protein
LKESENIPRKTPNRREHPREVLRQWCRRRKGSEVFQSDETEMIGVLLRLNQALKNAKGQAGCAAGQEPRYFRLC